MRIEMNARMLLWVTSVAVVVCCSSGCQSTCERREAELFRKLNHPHARTYQVLEAVSPKELEYHIHIGQQRLLGLVEGIEKRKDDAIELRNYLEKVRRVSLDLLSEQARLGITTAFERFLLQRFEMDVLGLVAGAEPHVEKPDELFSYTRDTRVRLSSGSFFSLAQRIAQVLYDGGRLYYFESLEGDRLIPGFIVLRDSHVAFRYEENERER